MAGSHIETSATPDQAGASRPRASMSENRNTSMPPATTSISTGRAASMGTTEALMSSAAARAEARSRSTDAASGRTCTRPGGAPYTTSRPSAAVIAPTMVGVHRERDHGHDARAQPATGGKQPGQREQARAGFRGDEGGS